MFEASTYSSSLLKSLALEPPFCMGDKNLLGLSTGGHGLSIDTPSFEGKRNQSETGWQLVFSCHRGLNMRNVFPAQPSLKSHAWGKGFYVAVILGIQIITRKLCVSPVTLNLAGFFPMPLIMLRLLVPGIGLQSPEPWAGNPVGEAFLLIPSLNVLFLSSRLLLLVLAPAEKMNNSLPSFALLPWRYL